MSRCIRKYVRIFDHSPFTPAQLWLSKSRALKHDLLHNIKSHKLFEFFESALGLFGTSEIRLVGWLGGFGFNGPLRQYSVCIGPSPKERER